MNSKVIEFSEVKRFRSPFYVDSRGAFCQAFSESDWRKSGGDGGFVQDNWSLSHKRGTVRGLHFQTPPYAQAKLIQVISGSIFDVVVDIRRSSPTFGCHMTVQLDSGPDMLFVPTGFAHGFMSLAPDTIVYYKVSVVYEPASEGGIRWNDPDLDIDWPLAPADGSISNRDAALPHLRDLYCSFS
jgi:dTDP-4-dehydrorhamnose 3,5-epimerase